MAAPNPKIIGDLGLNQFENYISGVAGGSANKASTERLIKTAGLEGSSDPFEKMFSAFTSHIENFGVTEEMERKLGSISREYKNIEDAPHLVQEYVKNVNTGKELHLASTKPTAPKASKLKVSKTPEEVFQAESQARANAMFDSDWAAHQEANKLKLLAEKNKLKSLAENPDDLYAKYLDHVGRIKSEGGILSPDSISLRRWFPRRLHK